MSDTRLRELLEKLEIALYGKGGNTWEVGRLARVTAVLEAAVLLGGTPQEQETKEDPRDAPLTAGADGQELPRRSQPGAVTAAEPLRANAEMDGGSIVLTGDARAWRGVFDNAWQTIARQGKEIAGLQKQLAKERRAASGGIASSPRATCGNCGHSLDTHDEGPSEDGCRFVFGWGPKCNCGYPAPAAPVRPVQEPK